MSSPATTATITSTSIDMICARKIHAQFLAPRTGTDSTTDPTTDKLNGMMADSVDMYDEPLDKRSVIARDAAARETHSSESKTNSRPI